MALAKFGVVVLEIARGRRPTRMEGITTRAFDELDMETLHGWNILNAVDEELKRDFDDNEMTCFAHCGNMPFQLFIIGVINVPTAYLLVFMPKLLRRLMAYSSVVPTKFYCWLEELINHHGNVVLVFMPLSHCLTQSSETGWLLSFSNEIVMIRNLVKISLGVLPTQSLFITQEPPPGRLLKIYMQTL
ncbi:hypothetical protein VNO78_29058 [Psophocarpus tetragonolobus]|uniref:Uncharacterized protein n=1 Tax=Psophocarpus tetragonolobus TaxID=3891 RepID=A0AAN9RU85_PSOTE